MHLVLTTAALCICTVQLIIKKTNNREMSLLFEHHRMICYLIVTERLRSFKRQTVMHFMLSTCPSVQVSPCVHVC